MNHVLGARDSHVDLVFGEKRARTCLKLIQSNCQHLSTETFYNFSVVVELLFQ